jgi:hypothetical protein
VEDAVGMVPFVRDIISLWQGYSVERMDMEGAALLVRAAAKWQKWAEAMSTKEPAKERLPFLLQDTIKAISTVFGVPIKSASRELESAFRTYVHYTGGDELDYTATKIFYNIKHEGNRGKFLDILYRTFKDGDASEFRRIQSDMIDSGFPPSKIKSGLKSRYNKDEDTEKGVKALERVKENPELFDFITMLGVELDTAPKEETEPKYSIDNLDSSGYQLYQDTQLSRLYPVVDSISRDPLYLAMKEQEQAHAMGKAYTCADELALMEASGGEYTTDKEWVEYAARSRQELGLTEADYILYATIYGDAALKSSRLREVVAGGVDAEKYLAFAEAISDFTAAVSSF